MIYYPMLSLKACESKIQATSQIEIHTSLPTPHPTHIKTFHHPFSMKYMWKSEHIYQLNIDDAS